ncbi:MAG: DUF4013 domain-containing protein [Opitutaceae bacterium]|jgi:hypothetical protein
MPSLEQVCKRLFSRPWWYIKAIIGALLLIVPVLHFFAFGYLYAMVEQARRGDEISFPEWGDWRRMFVNGVATFVIFLVLCVAPILIAWMLTYPLRVLPINYGVFVYLPLMPALMLAGPLSAAGLYQYQKRGEYKDAFRLGVLIAMLRSTKGYFWVPTLALIGLMVVGMPLMTFTVFVGLAASWVYYTAYFRFVEETRKNSSRP